VSLTRAASSKEANSACMPHCPTAGDGDVVVYDAHAVNLGLIELYRFKAHKFASVMCVDFNSDGSLLASGGSDGALRVWRRYVVGESAATAGLGHRRCPQLAPSNEQPPCCPLPQDRMPCGKRSRQRKGSAALAAAVTPVR